VHRTCSATSIEERLIDSNQCRVNEEAVTVDEFQKAALSVKLSAA